MLDNLRKKGCDLGDGSDDRRPLFAEKQPRMENKSCFQGDECYCRLLGKKSKRAALVVEIRSGHSLDSCGFG